jgi:hypothetical protein
VINQLMPCAVADAVERPDPSSDSNTGAHEIL